MLQQPSQSAPQTAPASAPASAPAPAQTPAPVQYNVKGRLKTTKKDKKEKKRRVGIRPAQDVVFRGRIVNPVAYENLRNEPENQPGKDLVFRNNKKEMKINRLNIFR